MSNLVLLEGIYILTTVFAVGVTAIESMGLLGDSGDDNGGADDDGGLSSDDGAEATDSAHGSDGVVVRGDVLQQRPNPVGQYIFKVLGVLRLIVYFTLGFGPMGLVAIVLGTGALLSLVLAIPAGIITCVMYRSFIRWQRKDVDSTVYERDLVGHQAKVLFAIYPNETGRVRITLAQRVCDRYATSDSNDFIPKGALVDVLAATGDSLVVAMAQQHD